MKSSLDRSKFMSILPHVWPELLIGCMISLAYLFGIPLWEAPDEPAHYGNIVLTRKKMIHPLTQGQSGLRGPMKGETSQPPLYYILSRWLSEPWANPEHISIEPVEQAICRDTSWRFQHHGPRIWPRLIRSVSIAFLLMAGLLTAHAAREAVPLDRDLPAAAMAMMWAVPQVMFLGATISNDSIAMSGGALLLFLWFRLRNSWSYLRLGCVGCLGMGVLMAKFNLLPLYFAGILMITLVIPWSFRRYLRSIGTYLLPAVVLLAAIWLIWPGMINTIRWILVRRVDTPMIPIRPLLSLPVLWESYWGRFGWMNVAVPGWLRLFFFTTTVILILGCLHTFRTRHQRVMLLSAIFVGAMIVGTLADLRFSGQAQGRHLFPAICAFSLLGAFGLRGFLSPRRARIMASVLALVLNGYVIVVLLPSAYGQPPDNLTIGTSNCSGNDVSEHITPGRPQEQFFISERSFLNRVAVVPATFGRSFRGTLLCTLEDVATGESVARRTVTAKEIRDGRWLTIDFDPIERSKEREYILRIEALHDIQGDVALFYSEIDKCRLAHRLSGPGDLRFVTYHAPFRAGGESR